METVSSPAYLYFFSRVPPAADADRYGAYHTAEIPYVFDNFGVSPHPYANRDYSDTDRKLSDILASYWVNLAATGEPERRGAAGVARLRPPGRRRPAGRRHDHRRAGHPQGPPRLLRSLLRGAARRGRVRLSCG